MTTDPRGDRGGEEATPSAPSPGDPVARATDDAEGGIADRAAAAFAAYRDGDHQQMGVLVDLVTPLLWHTARAQRLPDDSAREVVQTTWVRLVESATTVHDPQAVLGWLLTTVRREAWRTSRRESREELGADPLPEGPAAGPGPERMVMLSQRQRVLWQHVAALGDRCRHLLRVIAFGDRPDYATIAEALGMPVGSIGPTRGRCLSRLRRSLEGDPAWDGGRE